MDHPETPVSKPETPILPSPLPVKHRYHFLLVPDEGDGAILRLESDDLAPLLHEAYAALLRNKTGHAYFIIDGAKCKLSWPQQVFQLVMPDGSMTELADGAAPVFDQHDRFRVLI
jgi:hypothetical protein